MRPEADSPQPGEVLPRVPPAYDYPDWIYQQEKAGRRRSASYYTGFPLYYQSALAWSLGKLASLPPPPLPPNPLHWTAAQVELWLSEVAPGVERSQFPFNGKGLLSLRPEMLLQRVGGNVPLAEALLFDLRARIARAIASL